APLRLSLAPRPCAAKPLDQRRDQEWPRRGPFQRRICAFAQARPSSPPDCAKKHCPRTPCRKVPGAAFVLIAVIIGERIELVRAFDVPLSGPRENNPCVIMR